MQLFEIHVFIKSGDNIKQVPVCNVLMSRRQTIDYTAVFQHLKTALDVEGEIMMEEAVLDFESATWNSLRDVFPDVAIHGCIFHFVQGVYRRVQKLGLSVPYKKEKVKRNLIKKIYCLPFLPVRDMLAEFANLK